MTIPNSSVRGLIATLTLPTIFALANPAFAQQPVQLLGANCTAITDQPVSEPGTQRTFVLDYPCDLQPGEDVTVILNLHGGGSSERYQRPYFPAWEFKEKYRLVVATPHSPARRWREEDDQYLHNVVTAVFSAVGEENVRAFWLAGHSQGGITSRRIVCTEFFESKVDGFVSLSGGRLGGAAPRSPGAGRPTQANAAPVAAPATPVAPVATAPAADPTCDFSHIYAIGEYEIAELPDSSTLAERYQCDARVRLEDVIDTEAGRTHDSGSQNPGTREWGLLPRPGTAQVYEYPNCANGRVIADVVRIDKGHTEGLEPRIVETIVGMMTR
ncbi:MAG: alpha/beta hydrolase [Gammaproteobacteria bacterium]|nr:alpha/beta hydrolase [Gammaproteobacteria bacterium]MDP2141504.1 alpha/beta hydrolase [Gammaproteobacteria bacterium]MDP2347471.1 alpha/beta hydrolase [Gammaproteobacteria bacterium]